MQPRFIAIKTHLLDSIERGDMKPGDKVASENQLAEQHSVSRMTARRALTELVDEGILARSQGLGTFVSDHRPMSSMLTIRSIREEIIQRGHSYSNRVVLLETIRCDEQQGAWLDLAANEQAYRSVVVHCENQLPVQIEDRLVNPAWAPDYLAQDFHQQTANHYLNQVAPLTEADHVVEAVCPTPLQATQLDITEAQPCLRVSRRTFSNKGTVSFAILIHPGNRYRLGSHIDI